MKFQAHDTYKRDEKLTTISEPTDNSDVINEAYLDEKLLKRNVHIPFLKKNNNEFKLEYNKQNVE